MEVKSTLLFLSLQIVALPSIVICLGPIEFVKIAQPSSWWLLGSCLALKVLLGEVPKDLSFLACQEESDEQVVKGFELTY
jgi:hypothetical protein